MSHRRPARRPYIATLIATGGAAPVAESALQLSMDREAIAPPEATCEIAAWVNEGGAGGEVKR
jgi:hypothetical protein